jgi:hypothetical protein
MSPGKLSPYLSNQKQKGGKKEDYGYEVKKLQTINRENKNI